MKIVFFSPHSAIWIHAFPEGLVAESLQQSGHEVTYVTCGGMLDAQCVVMSSTGVDYRDPLEKRRQVCTQCTARKQLLKKKLGLIGYDLAEMLQKQDVLEIEDILRNVNEFTFLGLEIDGIPVGRYALYELILRKKKGNTNLDKEEWLEYKALLRGALVAFFAGRRILEREKPDRVVTYNSLYAVTRVFSHIAQKRGATSYFLHAGGNLSRRLQTLMIGRDHTLHFIKNLIEQWSRLKSQPCSASMIDQITQHFLVLFSGRSIYSYSTAAGRHTLDVRSRFGVRKDQQLLVAAMSSPDERFAAETVGALQPVENALFPTQREWIDALLEYVSERSDLFLLVRVHPREFPNRREGTLSQNAEILMKVLENLPPNVRVNWPSDGISLYDLANHADVILNAWSSAGKEMALLGLPVVAYSPELFFYPGDLNYIGETRESYFRCIEEALQKGWSIERSRNVFRWLAVEYGQGLIDISDSYRHMEGSLGIARRAWHRFRKTMDGLYVEKRDCRRRAALLAARLQINALLSTGAVTPLELCDVPPAQPGALDAEDRALRRALGRIGVALYGTDDRRNESGPLARRLLAMAEE
ncbi:MAG TPA: hypothetical protein VFV71_00275 [Burkholderiales bacterium]|nr:hypothetical protein [Burkholderiales bacterium]